MAIFSRRELCKFLGGSALGAFLTPLPWKVLDDVSIWTQNWSWIPATPRGEETCRRLTCTMCPSGCAVRARLVSGYPFALAGVAAAPWSSAFLCPAGLAGHHLLNHPARLRSAYRVARSAGSDTRRETPLTEVIEAVAARLATLRSAKGSVAILDTYPGRAASSAYQAFLGRIPAAVYIPAPSPGEAALQYSTDTTWRGMELGVDLERTRTILSFGADLFEGWGSPGRMFKLFEPGATRPSLIQVEAMRSNTAEKADVWLPAKPGSEAALALALAAVLVNENLIEPRLQQTPELRESGSVRSLLARVNVRVIAEATNVPEEMIKTTARRLAAGRPAVVLGGGDHATGLVSPEHRAAVGLLNGLLGSIGVEGGIIPRAPLPAPGTQELSATQVASDFGSVPDQSLDLLLIDSTSSHSLITAGAIGRKLAPNAMVVCVTAAEGPYTGLADYVVPAPAYLEATAESPTPFDSPVASFGLSTPLAPPAPGLVSMLQFLNQAAQKAGLDWQAISEEELIESRIQSIWKAGRGSVLRYEDGSSKPITEFGGAEEFSKALRDGGRWLDTPVAPGASKIPWSWDKATNQLSGLVEELGSDAQHVESKTQAWLAHSKAPDLWLVPYGSGFMARFSSPLSAKLNRESRLYLPAGEALINPETLAKLRLDPGTRSELETEFGKMRTVVRADERVMPGCVFVAAFSFPDGMSSAADVRAICEMTSAGAIRPTAARIRRLDV